LARVDMGVEHFITKRQRVEKVVVDMWTIYTYVCICS
jgi:hypothetical protein